MRALGRAGVIGAVALTLAVGVAVPSSARAEEAPQPPRSTAITFSITTPLVQVLEVAWEESWGYGFSTVLMGGVGSVALDDTEEEVSLVEVGVQARYTFVGDFDDGMGVALMGRYLWAGALRNGSRPHGYAIGPHLFFRVISQAGLTLDLYLGGSLQVALLENPRSAAQETRIEPIPTSGVSLGWSFGQ